MSRLMLIPVLVAVGTASAQQPEDSRVPLAVTVGPLELSARNIDVKTRSSQQRAGEIDLLNCSLDGDASLRLGEIAASEDRITVTTDEQGQAELYFRGNCRLTEEEDGFIAVADEIRLIPGDHMMLLSGSSGSARLTHGKGEQATVIEGSSIRFDLKSHKVQTADGTRVQFGE